MASRHEVGNEMKNGKLDLKNVALKTPNKAKRNDKNRTFFNALIFGVSVDKRVKPPKDLREEYSKIMEDYEVTIRTNSRSNPN